MQTAVIYARYSSEKQTEQSIEGQIRTCEEYAQRNDILIIDTYIDRAMSGTNDNRTSFQKMLKDSYSKSWDMVLVYKLDRFSRNKYEMAIHRKTLKDNGVALTSVTENIPKTPEGIILESLLEGMAEYYSAELAQKVSRGMRESWIKGHATGGGHAFGYDIIDKKYVINQNEAKIVQEMFTRYSKGYTALSIANYFNEQGYRRTDNKPFDQKYILDLLEKRHYTGVCTRQGVEYKNIYPPIISDELFEKVYKLRELRKHSKNRRVEIFDYYLSDKLICGVCNGRMFGESGTSGSHKTIHKYYSCSDKRHGKKNCTAKSIQKDYLEDLVIHYTLKLLSNKSQIDYIASKLEKAFIKKQNDNEKLKLLTKQKLQIEKAIENILKAIENGITTELTQKRLESNESELKKINYEINKEKKLNTNIIKKDEITKFLSSLTKKKKITQEIRREIVNIFINKVVVYPEKIYIIYNIIDPSDNMLQNAESPEEILHQANQDLEKQSSTALSLTNNCSCQAANGLPFATRIEPSFFLQKIKNGQFLTVFFVC